MSERVHPSAIIDPSASLAGDVLVGAYAIIEAGASVGPGCCIAAHAIIRQGSVLEENVQVDSFAVISGLPQDLSFEPATKSSVHIGAGTVIREGVTIHRSTQADGVTRIGKNCLLMANAHVAHDCQLGDKVILANNAMLAGHVHIGSGSFLGGGCGIHQFVSIGKLVMVAGNASVTYDVPSYLMVAERSTVTGLNLVGLKRNLPQEAISDLRSCYKAVYLKSGDPVKWAKAAEARTTEGMHFLACFENSRRGRYSRSKAQSK
ncbi:MAG: acyl-ACP--UDP-N-acetylglucosamine O-acyltransferase [Opitutales bacterium]